MLVYLSNIILIIIWAFVFLKGKRTRLKDSLFVIICFGQLLIISTLRYKIGIDYVTYQKAFTLLTSPDYPDLKFEDWEVGYLILNKFVGLFSDNFRVMLAVTSILSLAGPAYIIWRFSDNPFISVFLYVNLYLFYLDMSFVRQAIAMSIICFAYTAIRDKKFWRFLFLTVLAATFHATVLYMIPVFFICMLPINIKTYALYLAAIPVYYIFSDLALNKILPSIHEDYVESKFITHGVYASGAVFPLLICGGILILTYYLRNIPKHFIFLIHATLLMGFWQIVMTKHALFERFSYFTMVFVVVAVPNALTLFIKQYYVNLRYPHKSTWNELDNNKKSADPTAKAEAEHTKKQDKKSVPKPLSRNEAKIKAKKVTAIIALVILVLAFAHNMLGLVGHDRACFGILPYKLEGEFQLPDIDSFFRS